jgi:uncharacterized membrane protein YccC
MFAVNTTASALIALLVAFTFNLDQPQWALLAVFIVAQPRSGLVLAKSFYRIIGTLIGAAVALLLVSLFAQERVPSRSTLPRLAEICCERERASHSFGSCTEILQRRTRRRSGELCSSRGCASSSRP